MNGLQFIRLQYGISEAELAKRLTVSQPTVFEWEHGKRRIPESRKKTLSEIFNIPQEYFGNLTDDKLVQLNEIILENQSTNIKDAFYEMKIRIDTYYDITCDYCSRSWSTDFNANDRKMNRNDEGGMGMKTNKQRLSRLAYASGWKCKNGKTLCPECVEKEK